MNKNVVKLVTKTLSDFEIDKGSTILDVGCGNGDLVNTLCQLGFDAYGIDVEFKKGNHVETLQNNGRIKLIDIGSSNRESLSEGNHYSWPNFSKDFDAIISRAVIEHVRNLAEFVQSSKNQLKPKGILFHYYPSKCSLIEPHTGVPVGAVLKYKWWYWLMCSTGFCFKDKRQKWKAAYEYMDNFTSFRWQKDIDDIFLSSGFRKVDVTKNILLAHESNFWQLLGKNSISVSLFSTLRSKAVAYKPI